MGLSDRDYMQPGYQASRRHQVRVRRSHRLKFLLWRIWRKLTGVNRQG